MRPPPQPAQGSEVAKAGKQAKAGTRPPPRPAGRQGEDGAKAGQQASTHAARPCMPFRPPNPSEQGARAPIEGEARRQGVCAQWGAGGRGAACRRGRTPHHEPLLHALVRGRGVLAAYVALEHHAVALVVLHAARPVATRVTHTHTHAHGWLACVFAHSGTVVDAAGGLRARPTRARHGTHRSPNALPRP